MDFGENFMANLIPLQTHIAEFWTAKQRAGHSLHEVSYRACYKPQLPAYFIKEFCKSKSVIYDPFMGRGTTLIEAQMHGHRAIGNDVNPLSRILVYPRLNPPILVEIEKRLHEIILPTDVEIDEELLVFFMKTHLERFADGGLIFNSRNVIWLTLGYKWWRVRV